MDRIIKLQTLQEAQALFGPADGNIRAIEEKFRVKVTVRGEYLKLSGTAANIKKAAAVIARLLEDIRSGQGLENITVEAPGPEVSLKSSGKQIGPKTAGQRDYVEAIKKFDIVFGIGPAGTGKTYLAMACAVEALKKQEARRIILTRPAIEAGESLGFLPGDMYEKISPYLRPLYDALYDMMDAERIEKYLETGIIEVA
ncbi:MAG: PhoH family protein, partial [Candidatus Omnitrophica bacterium]|nr:PhoH family protein [Candidatus Omnitrophota bacterium]